MRMTVLGSAGTYPSPTNPASGYLLQDTETAVWLDAGPGTFARLSAVIDPHRIDGIVLSHAHPDHCTDIFAAYHYFRHGAATRRAIPLVVPDGLTQRIGGFLGGGEHFADTFSITVAGQSDGLTLGTIALRFATTLHPVPTLATRATSGGRSITYTADTGWSDAVIALAAETDLLVAEAAMQGSVEDKRYTHHLTAGEAGRLAAVAGARRLVLTHIPPHLDPARSIDEAETTFGREVSLAVPDATFHVSP